MKIDMHTHTEFSRDSSMKVDELIERAKARCLDGIAVTDHNTMDAVDKIKKLRPDINIIPGMEITTDRGEILGLFLTDEITNTDPKKVVEEIRAQGGIAVVPHPFDPFRSFDGWKKIDVDGIEVFNSRNLTSGMNKKAMEHAEKNQMIKTAGSDAHSPWEVGKAYVEADAKNIEEFKERLINGEVEIRGQRGSFMSYVYGNIEKLKKSLKK